MNYDEALPVARLRELIDFRPESGELIWRRRGAAYWDKKFAGTPCCGTVAHNGYLKGCVMGRDVRAHRLMWALHYGVWPTAHLDHLNGDRRDNRIANLAEASPAENMRNRCLTKNNESGHFGVYRRGPSWTAYIGRNYKYIYLGSFPDLASAIAARKAAEKKHGFHENHGRQPHPTSSTGAE